MAYTALYRRFRPQRFEDLVGQDHIVRTLINQLDSGRIAHAYLFSGPRGTGKTSTAKLFARAVNCASCVNGNPCGHCTSCTSFDADDNMDIIEIDAASNNGVDNIRDIRDKVIFAPAYGKYKVYIIDEVHMLSGGAFNALLKTLEEPPKHAVFILATTEIHKIPATILSRCQRFDFKLISVETIAARLEYALKESNVNIESDAINLIATCADGGMRDALSLADVCISYCGNNISYNDVRNVLGISDRSFVFDFTDMLIAGDAPGALKKCGELKTDGKDFSVFVSELTEHLRDVMLYKYAPDCDSLRTFTEETRQGLASQSQKADISRILRALEILSSFEKDIKAHSKPEILLECAVARICLPESEGDILSLCDRINVIEEKLKSGTFTNTENTATHAQTNRQTLSDAPSWDVDTPKKESNVPPSRASAQNAPADAQRFVSEIPKTQPIYSSSAAQQAKPTSSAQSAKSVFTQKSGDVWRLLMDKVKQNDIPLYMMLRSFDGDFTKDGVFCIYVPETAKAKIPLITKNADTLSSYLEEIKGQKFKIEASLGARPKTESNENPLVRAALDLFS